MNKSLNVVIYHTKGCQKCRLTAQRFEQANISITQILVDPNTEWGQNKLGKFKLSGYQSFPVIRIYSGIEDDGSEPIDSWSDLRLDKIKQWTKNK